MKTNYKILMIKKMMNQGFLVGLESISVGQTNTSALSLSRMQEEAFQWGGQGADYAPLFE